MKITKEVRKAFSIMGKRGGMMSAQNMTAEERSARARKAVKARWAKAKPNKVN